jgi:hypothetical protein|nr:MAG TPA_asm: Glucitol operon activator protein (GutM) [Caudoviricetes sp.]
MGYMDVPCFHFASGTQTIYTNEIQKTLKEEKVMTKEDIEKTANEFADREYEYNDIDRNALYKGFYWGAQWRINSVWHDVNVEPTEKKVLVVIDADGNISQSLFMVGVDVWKDFVEDTDIVKWCYKENLLPNMEG